LVFEPPVPFTIVQSLRTAGFVFSFEKNIFRILEPPVSFFLFKKPYFRNRRTAGFVFSFEKNIFSESENRRFSFFFRKNIYIQNRRTAGPVFPSKSYFRIGKQVFSFKIFQNWGLTSSSFSFFKIFSESHNCGNFLSKDFRVREPPVLIIFFNIKNNDVQQNRGLKLNLRGCVFFFNFVMLPHL